MEAITGVGRGRGLPDWDDVGEENDIPKEIHKPWPLETLQGEGRKYNNPSP